VRIGILADTHGVLDPRILEALDGTDVILHAGDVGSAAIVRSLQSAADRVLLVRGNNDVPSKWSGSERTLDALPTNIELDAPGGVIAVVHGDRVLPAKHRHQRLRELYPHARAIVYGHSHRRLLDLEETPWVINPGAAGKARTFGGPSACILSAGLRRWSVETVLFERQ
jgi:putative phosphoesterase